ncbi:MAG: TetR/AcrR family transcriptional regulator [Lachnospiraceae bacterium]|nr:TetR/AcrR family transcriptional regulator [Lachnospiraceae bacterium]
MSKSYHHGDLKNELIKSGIKMIQQDGIEKLSLRKLASICGVSEAAPYSHFENKDQLLAAMQEYVTEQLTQCLKYAVERTDKQNSVTAISNMGKAYVLFFMEHPEYYTFLFTQPCVKIDLSMNSNSEEFLPFHYYKVKAYEIYRGQGLPEDRIKYGIIAMWAKVHGMAAIVSMKYITKDFEWEDVFDQILME